MKKIIKKASVMILAMVMILCFIPGMKQTVKADAANGFVGVENILQGLNSNQQIMAGRAVTFEYADLMQKAGLTQLLLDGTETTVGILKDNGEAYDLTPSGSTYSFTASSEENQRVYYITITINETGEVYQSNGVSVNAYPVVTLSFDIVGQGTAVADKYEVQLGEKIHYTITPEEGWYFYEMKAISGDYIHVASMENTIELGREDTVIQVIFKELVTSGSCGPNATYSFDTQTGALTITGTGAIAEKAFYNEYLHDWDAIKSVEIGDGITEIGKQAFCYCQSMTSVSFPESLTEIGEQAFYVCKGLTSVDLPSGLKTLKTGAFQQCSYLQSVTFPDGLETIGTQAFFIDDLRTITIPASVTYLGTNVFNSNKYLNTAVINAQIEELPDATFSGCTGLSSVTLPNTLKKIAYYAFNRCSALRSITIPESVTEFGENVFYNSGLQSVSIPDGVTELPGSLFNNCKALTSVDLPDNLQKIGVSAFQNCEVLQSIEIPETVTVIDSGAFGWCKRLEQINIPSGVTKLGIYTFTNCSQLKSIDLPEGLTELGESVFTNAGLMSLTLPNGLEKIGEYTFSGNPIEGTVTIPASVTELDEGVFYNTKINAINNLSSLSFTIRHLFGTSTYPNAQMDVFVDSDGNEVETIGHGLYTKKEPEPPVANIADASVTGVTDMTYTGKVLTQKPVVTMNGSTLTEGVDYKLSYESNLFAGKAAVIITGIGAYEGSQKIPFTIKVKPVKPVVILSRTAVPYNGKVQMPSITVKDGAQQLYFYDDYTFSYGTGFKNVGVYEIKVTLKGNYSGSAVVNYTILPKSTAIAKVTPAKRAFTVKWKKQAAQITGYQIQYCMNSKFKSKVKTVDIKGAKVVSRKFTKLKAKKQYYVRIRTYKTVGKNTYYSAWSKAKSVKTK